MSRTGETAANESGSKDETFQTFERADAPRRLPASPTRDADGEQPQRRRRTTMPAISPDAGAERDAHADLVRLLRDGVRDHAVDADDSASVKPEAAKTANSSEVETRAGEGVLRRAAPPWSCTSVTGWIAVERVDLRFDRGVEGRGVGRLARTTRRSARPGDGVREVHLRLDLVGELRGSACR